MRRVILPLVGGALLLATLTGCSIDANGNPSFGGDSSSTTSAPATAPALKDMTNTLMGTVTLKTRSMSHIGTVCQGTGGFNDLRKGLTVTIRKNGVIAAQTQLDEGFYFAGMEGQIGSTAAKDECNFTFHKDLVDPDRSAVWTVEVGDRGELVADIGREVFSMMFMTIGDES